MICTVMMEMTMDKLFHAIIIFKMEQKGNVLRSIDEYFPLYHYYNQEISWYNTRVMM